MPTDRTVGATLGLQGVTVLLTASALLASCGTPSARQTLSLGAKTNESAAASVPSSDIASNGPMQASTHHLPSQDLTSICSLDASMTNLSESLFADEDLIPTSASERRRKLQEQARRLSTVKALPNVSREVRAEALFWCIETCLRLRDHKTADRMFKELTRDYPSTKWAGLARHAQRLREERL